MPYLVGGALLLGGGVLTGLFRRRWRHGDAVRRLYGEEGERPELARRLRRPRRLDSRGLVPLTVGVAIALIAKGLSASLALAVALGLLASLVAHMVEQFVLRQRVLRLETQLAEAIDMTVSALSAGSSPADALDLAARECPLPLAPYLKDLVERLRLGDHPETAFAEFERRLPLESVRLLRFALAAHWEGGGEVGPTLASVARSARDRIALVQRVQSQSSEAQASVVGVLAISYALAAVMWRSDPERLSEFLASQLGGWLVPSAVVLQAVGLLWISRLTRVEF